MQKIRSYKVMSRRILYLLVAILFFSVSFSTSAGVFEPNAPPAIADNLWVANQRVHTALVVGDILYIGGNFSYVGPPTGFGAAIDASTAVVDLAMPAIDGIVYAVAADGAGGWYVGGSFSSVAGTPRANLVHITASRDVDPIWNPAPNQVVRALAVMGGTVYVGGSFTNIGGAGRNHIAALGAATGRATAWNPNANDTVYTILPFGGSVYVGGTFDSIGGASRPNLAELDAATGLATAWNANVDFAVFALEASSDTLYVGGTFSRAGGQPRNRLAAFDLANGQLKAWDPNSNGYVYALAVAEDKVYTGGIFSSIGGQTRLHLAALDLTTAQPIAWRADAGEDVQALALGDGALYAGGLFTSVGGVPRNFLAALDLETGQATSWDPNPNGSVTSMAAGGYSLFVGGGFLNIGGVMRDYLAEFNLQTGEVTSWAPPEIFPPLVWTIVLTPDTVYIGGEFTEVGNNVFRYFIASLDRVTGQVTAWNPNANLIVRDMELVGDTLFVAGDFTHIGGAFRNGLAAFNPPNPNALAWNPDIGQDWLAGVYDLEIDGDTAYVGGRFHSLGGQPRNHLGSVDLASGAVTDWNPAVSQFSSAIVRSLEILDGIVYFGGDFWSVAGQQRLHAAAVDQFSGALVNWDPEALGILEGGLDASGFVYDVALSPDQVYLGGEFIDIAQGSGHSYIAGFESFGGHSGTPTVTPTLDPTSTAIATSTPTATAGIASPTPRPTRTPTGGATPTATLTPVGPTPTPTQPTVGTGFLSPAANSPVTVQSGDNNGFEVSPANAQAEDGLFAQDINSGMSASDSCGNRGKDRHSFSNFNFNLPPGVIITGIQVRLDALVDATVGAPQMCVELSWDGGLSWTATQLTPTLATGEMTYLLGGPGDSWGRAWQVADFSDANFRLRITNVAASTARDFSLDWAAVNVIYE